MQVSIPSPLQAYTGGARAVTASGATLATVLDDLDRQFPGLRFRMVDEHGAIRPHMRVFRNGRQTFDLATPLAANDTLHIVQALSGG